MLLLRAGAKYSDEIVRQFDEKRTDFDYIMSAKAAAAKWIMKRSEATATGRLDHVLENI